MGCLYSVFDVKKQGKLIWEVRTRNWKLQRGENRLWGLLEGISLGESKEARGIEYNICSSTRGYRYPLKCTRYRYLRKGIDTPCVNTPGIDTSRGVSVPKSPIGAWVSVLASEYRYQLSENRFWNSLKHNSSRLGP
ncbi:hypothetical protein GQ457_02G022380 [Hibiscus cannabinus]